MLLAIFFQRVFVVHQLGLHAASLHLICICSITLPQSMSRCSASNTLQNLAPYFHILHASCSLKRKISDVSNVSEEKKRTIYNQLRRCIHVQHVNVQFLWPYSIVVNQLKDIGMGSKRQWVCYMFTFVIHGTWVSVVTTSVLLFYFFTTSVLRTQRPKWLFR